MVRRGSRLADIGTDHGWVPIYLAQTGDIPSALAMDIGRGPLARAQEHIRQYGMEARIECRLSDGLDAYRQGECDSILIAGMGGELIISILERGREKLNDGMQLVLSPHTHVELVREYLDRAGHILADEICIYDEGKYYFFLDARVRKPDQSQTTTDSFAVPTESASLETDLSQTLGVSSDDDEDNSTDTDTDTFVNRYTNIHMVAASGHPYMISRHLTEKKDPVYRNYLTEQIEKCERLLEREGIGEARSRELKELAAAYRKTIQSMKE